MWIDLISDFTEYKAIVDLERQQPESEFQDLFSHFDWPRVCRQITGLRGTFLASFLFDFFEPPICSCWGLIKYVNVFCKLKHTGNLKTSENTPFIHLDHMLWCVGLKFQKLIG
jgi:hypothetical protein